MNLFAIVRHHTTGPRRARLAARLSRLCKRIAPKAGQAKGCLLWGAQLNNYGYGRLHLWFEGKRRKVTAHRLTWVLANGRDIPEGMELDHVCENTACVEPTHLEPVTHKENMRRAREGRGPRWTYADAARQAAQAAYHN